MRTHRRALPALVLAAGLLAPAVPASADWSCAFYKWQETTKTWKRLVVLYPKEEFEARYVKGVDWHCQYCVPVIVRREDPPVAVPGAVDSAVSVVRPVVQQYVTVPSTDPPSGGPVNPWDYPPCPPVPPEWDNQEVNDLLKP